MPQFVKFQLKFSEAVVGCLGVFFGLKNLIRAFFDARSRNPVTRLSASLRRVAGLVCLTVGIFYFITGIKIDFSKDEEYDDDDDEEEFDDEDEETEEAKA